MADNYTVGQAIGLQGKPDQYWTGFAQKAEAEKRRKEQEEALKQKKKDDEFKLLEKDFSIDPSKYHRIDRQRAMENYKGYTNTLWKLYLSGDPAWVNKARDLQFEAKFADQQIQSDSKKHFDEEAYVLNPNTVKSQGMMEWGKWLREGDWNNPPKIEAGLGGQIQAIDPNTRTINYVAAEQINAPKFAEESIYAPAEMGFDYNQRSLDEKLNFPTGETVYKRFMQYKPDQVEANIAATVGSKFYNNWLVNNEQSIRQALKSNPAANPSDVIFGLYSDYSKKMQPEKFETTIQSPPTKNVTNITVGGEPKAKDQTRWSDVSNVMSEDIRTGNLSYDSLAKTQSGNIVYRNGTRDPFGVSITVPQKLAEKVVTVPAGRGLTTAGSDGKPVSPDDIIKGRVSGIEFRYSFQDKDGNIEQVSQGEIDNWKKNDPEKLKQVVPYAVLKYAEVKDEEDDLGLGGKSIIKPKTFYVKYNLSQGSPDLDDLNATAPELFITARAKTELGTGKPGSYENTQKKKDIPQPKAPEPAKGKKEIPGF